MPDSPADTAEAIETDDAAVGAGLDALDTPTTTDRRSWARPLFSQLWPPILVLVLVVVIWQALWAAAFWPEYKLPAPGDVWATIWKIIENGDIFGFLWVSLHRAVIGFVIAVCVAIPLGLLIANFSLVRRGIGPIMSGLQSLPSVAWVPAAILWFGLTDTSIYFVVLLGAVPSITSSCRPRCLGSSPASSRAGRSRGARSWRPS